MKKLSSIVVSIMLMLAMVVSLVGCKDVDSENKPLNVKVTVEESLTTICGTEFEVPAPTVEGVENYEVSVSIADKDGNYVNYNEELNNFYAKKLGVDVYVITYTVSYMHGEKIESATATTKVTTTDGEKPTIKAPESVSGVRGDKVEVPVAEVVDNSGEAITATVVVKNDKGEVVELVEENGKKYVLIDEVAKYYTIVYSAVDSTGNKATDHECKVLIRNSINEVEYFDTTELVDVAVTSAEYEVVTEETAPAGGKGGVLKVHMPKANPEADGYVSISIRNLGVTNFTDVSKITMRAYSTVALSNNPGKHSGNAIVAGSTEGLATGRNLEANTWTNIVYNRNDIKEMFNGEKTWQGYQRPFIDEVQEIRLDIDNAGWWGSPDAGADGGEQWASQDITLYLDEIKVEYINRNWQPLSYDGETTTVYEINNFNDDARMDYVTTTAQDPTKITASLSPEHALPFDPAHPEQDNMALKVEFSSHQNGYPRFLLNMDKVAKLIDLAKLPDNAVIRTDIYVEQCGPGKTGIDGEGNFVFYNKGNNTELKAAMNYIWLEAGQSATVTTTIAAVKDAGVDLSKVETAGFFFYADDAYIDGPYSAVVYFDNFRIEVPNGKPVPSLKAEEKVIAEGGKDYVVPAPAIENVENYELKIDVTDKDGNAVELNAETNTFYAGIIGNDSYTVTYTLTYHYGELLRTLTATTVITTTDGGKPTINVVENLEGVRGKKIALPVAEVIDNADKDLVAEVVVKDDNGNNVEIINEEGKLFVVLNETAKYYVVHYNVADASGNYADEKTCKIKIIDVDNILVENFDGKDTLTPNTVASDAMVVSASEVPEGATGGVLKINMNSTSNGSSGYVEIYLRNLSVTDFTGAINLKMRVYSTVALSNNPGKHFGNAIVAGKTDGGVTGKSVPANTWTEIEWTKAEVEEMFNGKIGFDNKYQRPSIDNVTEIRLDIDNAGWWGSPAAGEFWGEQWASANIELYIDSISFDRVKSGFQPAVYKTATSTVYEINNFNDEERFAEVFTTSSDESKISATLSDQHALPFDPAHPEAVNKSLRVEFTSHPNGYPRFLVKMDKIAKAIGLEKLPDNAVIKLDIYVESCGPDKVVIDGGDNLVFYNAGDGVEKKSSIEYLEVNVGKSATVNAKLADVRKCGADLANLNTMGFFFYADKTWTKDYTAVVYFDNFRVEVPNA